MTSQRKLLNVAAVSLLSLSLGAFAAPPAITGTPIIEGPQLLDWERDANYGLPDLTEETANRLFDLHGTIGNCEQMDLVLSTAGNYHMALRELWQQYLIPLYGAEIRNWYYTTSPPVGPEQVTNENMVFGNLALKCRPQVAVGPGDVMNALDALGVSEGARIPIIRNYGNVILVKKGNPKHIHTIWDLGRPDVRVVTPSPTLEPGSFGNYSTSIYDIAANDPIGNGGQTPENLFNSIFNANGSGHHDGKHGYGGHDDAKWYAGGRIHHREVPWSIAYGHADASVIFYHLALYTKRAFPDMFDIVPLGGTVEDPQPLPGNRVATLFAVRIKGTWTGAQVDARERLIALLKSPEFTTILERHGLRRP
jgi:hypothetical protein